MVQTFRRSYAIFRQSLSILSHDKEILLFPILSGIVTALAFASMVFGGITTGFFRALAASGAAGGDVIGYVMLFAWYFVSWFIVLFFNVAVIQCARIRLDGGNPTVADGFRAAIQHVGRIATWALVSATVGLILKIVSERAKIVGRIISGLLGAAWAVATYFIVPVMIFERRTLKESVTQSTNLIAKTWGESLVAAGGIGVFTMLLALAGLGLPIIGFLIDVRVALVMLVVMIGYWVLLAVVSSALGAIYRTGLYLYAAEGRMPQGFTPEFVEHAFAPKGVRGPMAFGAARP